MADYAASVMARAQVMLNDQFQSAELREKPSPTLMALLEQRNFLIPDLKALRTREDRPTSTYLKNRTTRTLTNARTHNHTGNVGDSTQVDITYTTYTDRFSTSLKRGDNNIFSDAEILANEMRNSLINLHEGIETALVTYLDTNKTQVSAPPSAALKRATFNATNDVYEIAAGNSDEYWHIIASVFRQEKYNQSMFKVISDSLLTSRGEFQANQGTGNSTNLGFQFGPVDVNESIELTDANYAGGISLAWPMGLVGILDWIPIQNRQGKGNFDSVLGGFSTMTDPLTGLEFAVHAYTERATTAATNGNAQDEVTQWEMSIDLSPQHAPLTTANASPIFAFGQLV